MRRRPANSAIGSHSPVSASTTRVSPVTHFPRQTHSTFRGILKRSTVSARTNEFGGMMHSSPTWSTNDFESNAFGSTSVEFRLWKILKVLPTRTS